MTRMSLAGVTRGAPPRPPRLVIYGVHGIGKTTFGAGAPAPIVLRTEDGLGTLGVPTFPDLARTYEDVIGALGQLYQEPHSYQTLVLDTLDWLEPLVWARTAFLHDKEHIEACGYGKGYIYADEPWRKILDGLVALNEQRNMAIVCLAHAEIKRFDAPDSEPYDRYQVKLHKRAADLVEEWADVVGFAHYEVNTVEADVGFAKKVTRGVGSGRRMLAVEERPAYRAKNRYHLPPLLPLSWGAFAEAIAPAFAGATGHGLPEFPAELQDEPADEPASIEELAAGLSPIMATD